MWGRMSLKKEKLSLYLVYYIASLRKMAGKAEHFSRKIEKYLENNFMKNLENVVVEKICC